jgi:limonene-1,2-epoxide hydrolase
VQTATGLKEVFTVSDSAESVVRKFHAACLQSDLNELVSFFSDGAVYTDGPRGVHHGVDAIRAELAAMVKMVPSTVIDIKTLVANGGTVMVERVDNFEIDSRPFDLEVAAAFEVDDNGRITRWRDYYDLKSIADRTATAGVAGPPS